MSNPVVKDFMVTKLVTLRPEMDIYAAIDILLKNKISGAPVVDKDRNLAGVLSEKDCLRIFASGAFNQLPGGIVSDYMSKDIHTVGPEEEIFTVADMFFRNTFRRLPVVKDGVLVGQVSRRDVLKGSREIWERSSIKTEWTDAKYIPVQVQAALETKRPAPRA